MSPFDAARYARLLEGLEAIERPASEVFSRERMDSEAFAKAALKMATRLSKLPRVDAVRQVAAVSDGNHLSIANEFGDAESGVRYLRGQDINGAMMLDDRNPVYIPESEYEKLARSHIFRDDVLITIVGANTGQTALVDVAPNKLTANCKLGVLRAKRGGIAPAYLHAFLAGRYGQSQVLSAKRGGGQMGLILPDLKALVVARFSKRFEQRIADISTLAHKTNRARRTHVEKAEALLLSALSLDTWQAPEPLSYIRNCSEAFTSGRLDAEFFSPRTNAIRAALREKGDVSLSEIGLVSTGHPWRSDKFIERGSSEGVPFVRIRDCKPGAIDGEDLDRLPEAYAKDEAQPMAQPGDLVVGMDGLRWFYASSLLTPCYVNQRVGWLHNFEESFPGAYLIVVLNSLIGQSQLLSQMTIAQTVGHITLDDLRGLRVPTLQPSQRARIARKFMDSVVAKQRAAHLLDAAKRAIEIAIEDSEVSALSYLEQIK